MLAVWIGLPNHGFAQWRGPWVDEKVASTMFLDYEVEEALLQALKSLERAKCAPDQTCSPATPEELARPPISPERARIVLMVGFTSGKAEWCGLNWQEELFLPMMQHFRKVERLEPRHMATIALLHGNAQGRSFRAAEGDQCTEQIRDNLASVLSRFAGTLQLDMRLP